MMSSDDFPSGAPVAVLDDGRDCHAELAQRLGLPLVTSARPDGAGVSFILRFDAQDILHLDCRPDGLSICADFHSGRMAYRRSGHLRGEMLIKAAGMDKRTTGHVTDATAGLGRDAFLLAAAGYHVRMMERSAIVAALLDNALARAGASGDPVMRDIASRMTLEQGDSRALLSSTAGADTDVIYLDPMFPERRKSARVKKEMFVLGQLLHEGPEQDAALLPLALQCARNRVVVKRPRLAPVLGGLAPDWQLTGRSSRFDVYRCSTR